ncbi:DUF72 domain-containing protein [Acetobacter oeni]|uniref:Histidine kinase n=1 Tax=Acetobacter oeni TaxID=304077 RepID=A0A511XN89_9PROT|nr:DUF72 domain-containing protein [Acetobacter oeni]MBB3884244.1 uncharacterized protein YecE (DUF72 family) [Acetobacter oeni]NHO20166.1 DUF72 domain-containing protein [Acetobacter oeni]GBR01024.1 hypothetical protein AA21952_0290 [Acetobacter oeni LMG 21952]GEN64396.1 hypothetical protein AOE01nite_26200 [Acetobacter oeni]
MVWHIGTAGWGIASPLAASFPGEGTHLARYGKRLSCAEINSSFYRPHRRTTYERWAESVPPEFRFSVKMPRVITHEKRLTGTGDDVARFLDETGGLGEKLGVVLIQLPPRCTFDARVAEAFFTDLRERFDGQIACEPRHAEWFGQEAEALFAARHIARVAADPAPAPGAGDPGGWRGLTYRRLHGAPKMYYSDYSTGQLREIATMLRDDPAEEVWCIFDNTAEGHALPDALSLTEDCLQGR